MAGTTTYLTLVNDVLRELNEVELTSASFSDSRGVQTAVKGFINKAVNDLYNSEVEWPWLYVEGSQVTYAGQQEYTFPTAFRKANFSSFRLVPTQRLTNPTFDSNISSWTTVSGSPSFTSDGNGRLRLNASEVTQSINVVKNEVHKISVRVLDPSESGSSATLKIGTTSGGTQISSNTISVTDYGNGKIYSTDFTPTSSTIYIGLANADSTNLDIDYIKVSLGETPSYLKYVSYDSFLQGLLASDAVVDDSQYGKPSYVYRTPDTLKFGLSRIPDTDAYTIKYDYYKTHADLSTSTDTLDLPDRFADTVVNRAKYYLYKLRNDVPMANIANAEYEQGIKRMRVETLNKQDYVKDTRVNINSSNRTTSDTSVLTVI
jgi:hypothetical protein